MDGGGEVFWDDVEKEALRRLLWKMAEFSGVRLVTYCIMGNHFHALAEVPKREIWLERFAGVGGESDGGPVAVVHGVGVEDFGDHGFP